MGVSKPQVPAGFVPQWLTSLWTCKGSGKTTTTTTKSLVHPSANPSRVATLMGTSSSVQPGFHVHLPSSGPLPYRAETLLSWSAAEPREPHRCTRLDQGEVGLTGQISENSPCALGHCAALGDNVSRREVGARTGCRGCPRVKLRECSRLLSQLHCSHAVLRA